MAYAAPSIDITGLKIPSYNDILDYYTTQFQTVYGQNVYLGNDSPDFQLISIIALVASDVMNALQLIYNNNGPSFAIGPALDILVKLNGLTRKPASFSTCTVTLAGVAGTVITNGIVADVNGNLWNLPASVTIGGGGTVNVTATAQVAGPITVGNNQIISIQTPTAGWNTVTNGTNAPSVGVLAETDSQLRARQAVSTEQPSLSMVTGTLGDLEAVPGVTRVSIDENFTGATNGNGTPAHSIQCVVEGGLNLDVATAIYENKSIGCGTFGSTTVAVVDPISGLSNNISFDRPTNVPIFVTLGIHQLPGYSSAITTLIQNAVLNYLAGLALGQNVSFTALMAEVMNVNSNLDKPVFTVQLPNTGIGTASPTVPTNADIVLTFTQVAQGVLGDIVINFV